MTIIRLKVPLLVGKVHRPAGAVVIVGDSRALAMIAAGHAEPSNARHLVENPEDDRPDDPLLPSSDRPGIGVPAPGPPTPGRGAKGRPGGRP